MDTNEHDPSDGEWYLDPESLYQNLLAHKMNLDLGAASKQSGDSAAEKAQALRTLLTTNSFSEQTSDSQSGWHMERLEKYTALMDGTIENGGLNNHRGAVEQRLTGVNPVHSTWKVEESIPSMPTDADIEEHILSAEQFRAVYQDPLKAAQAKFSSGIQPARVVAKRKAVPANSGFTVPRRDTSRINNPAVLPEKLGHSQSGSVEGPRPPESETVAAPSSFKTAKEQLVVEMVEKGETVPAELKAGARPLSQPFVAPVSERNRLPPMAAKSKDENEMSKLVEMFEEYVVTPEDLCDVGEVVGLDDVKQNLELSVILPLMVECSGLNIPPKGLLLFGPPGTGKTLIGRWVAAQLVKGNDDWKRTVFISVTPSTLTSKWTGESEKLVRAMFQYARTKAPAVILWMKSMPF
ncbi:spastin-like [Paramacrobiotus metropolitanus]|uniref:spastin-like n=1 Tax=Paramacrobiotus metropolitanus TaxID=2943436 RepID=UPI0024462359|nr:spastin-like [Paramacrobiotus metropolitanus]